MSLHSQRFATEVIIQLSNRIPSIEIIMEYSVKPYRIDAYLPQYNIAIEIDEKGHAFYDKKKRLNVLALSLNNSGVVGYELMTNILNKTQ